MKGRGGASGDEGGRLSVQGGGQGFGELEERGLLKEAGGRGRIERAGEQETLTEVAAERA